MALLVSCAATPRTSIVTMPEGGRLTRTDDSLLLRVLEKTIRADGSLILTSMQGDTDLTAYLEQVALVRPEIFTSRQQQLALWLNAHNAYVLDYLRMNQTNHEDVGQYKGARQALIGGQRYSLYEIEHSILAHQFREPRAFFALYDGSKSCPELRDRPFTEDGLSDQLDEQVRDFFADSTKNYLDRKNNALYLSPVVQEYAEELEKPAGSVIGFVRAFAPPAMAQWIDQHPAVKISYLKYDHTLNASDGAAQNDIPRPPSQRKQPTRRTQGGIH
jgi:hypothetical protein